MNVRFLLVFLYFVSAAATDARAQDGSIRGRVEDAETGASLPGANVFLNQTMVGTTTDSRGMFEISGIPPGSYELVVSMLGYAAGQEQFEITSSDSGFEFNFQLEPVVLEMSEVEVTGSRPEGWQEDLDRFTKMFIGTGSNADETEIENPYVLEFSTRNDVFTATAAAPLEIVNKALGYRIVFILTEFEVDDRAHQVRQQGPFFFQELKKEIGRRTRKNRIETYRGSLQHILSSIIAGQTEAEGIDIKLDSRPSAPYSETEPFLKEVSGFGLMRPTKQAWLYRLSFRDYLFVRFEKEQSWIYVNQDEALVHETGYVYAPQGDTGKLTVYGALAGRAISDLLPREYRPE